MAKLKKKTILVDMEGVESGGRKVDDGDYTAVVHKVEQKESKEGNEMLVVQWKITSKSSKGSIVYDNVSLLPQALWRLKTILECIGEEVPDGVLELDPDDLVGKEARIEITNEKYEGKDRPKITGFGSLEDKGTDDDDDDKKDKDDDDDDDEKDDDDEDKPAPKKVTKPDARVGKSKFRVGHKVRFTDDEDKSHKGTIIELDDDTAKVEDAKGEEWEIDVSELEAA